MQIVDSTMDTALSAHDLAGGSFSVSEVVEIYAADYAIPTDGFDPADAEERFCGIEGFTYLGLAYQREYVDRSDVQKNTGKKENTCTANMSNVSRALAAYVQANDVEGKWLVIRLVDVFNSTTLESSFVFYCGRMDAAGDLDDTTGTLPSTQRYGPINLFVPPRTFGPNDPKGRAPNDPLFEGFRVTASQQTVLWDTRERSTGWGSLLGLTHNVHHSQQASSHTQTGADVVLPDGFGRVQVGVRYLGTIDIGNDINFTAAVMEGVIAEYISIRQTNSKFSQISADPALRYGYLGGEGPTGREQLPVGVVRPDLVGKIPGDGYYSRTAWFAGYVQGSTPDVDESEAPTWLVLVKAKIITLPDGTGSFVLEGWTDNPAYITRFLLTDGRYFNEGPDSVNDEQCFETGQYLDEYVIDNSQGERALVPQADIAQLGVTVQRFRSTGLIDSRAIRIGELSETIGGVSDAQAIPIDPEPFDPTDPPEPTDPEDPDAPTKAYLRKRGTCNLTITERMSGADFLYGPIAKTGRLYLKRNGKGRTDICAERPVDYTYIRGSVAAGDSTIKVLDVEPWKTGKLLTQRLLTGAHLTTSEVRNVTAASYTSDGNSVTLSTSVTGTITATRSGATFSGGNSSTPASATVTIGGTPASGNVVTITINGIAVSYTLDANDTTATVAAMLARLIHATPKLRQFIKASWTTGTNVINLSVRFGMLTLNSPLCLAHTAYVATPTTLPTLTAASGGSLPAGKVYLAYADANSIGETGLSPLMSISVSASQKINVAALSLPTGITKRRWYVSKYVNNGELVFHSEQTGSGFSITDLPDSTNALPLDWNTTGEELMRIAASYACNDQDGVYVNQVFNPYPLWQASKAVTLNSIYLPNVPNGHKYKVTTAGTTGTSEPTWPTTPGSITSGTAVFTEFGPTVIGQAGLTKSNIHANTLKWPLGSQQSSINQAKGTFFNAADDYAATQIEVNDYEHQQRTGKVNSLDVDLSGIDNYWQAHAQLNFELSKLRDGDMLGGWQTGPKGMLHEEGDVVCLSASSGGFINLPLRLEQINIGAGPPKGTYNTKLVGRKYSTLMFSDQVRQHSIVLSTTLRTYTPLPTLMLLLDLPAINEQDAYTPGFYALFYYDESLQGSWRGNNFWGDFGQGNTKLLSNDLAATVGTTSDALGAGSPVGLDTTSTLTVSFKRGAPTNRTVDEIIADGRANLAVYGNEYIQFANATLLDAATKTYQIGPGILRGRFGTEPVAHSTDERFGLMDAAVFVPANRAHLDETYTYTAQTVNQNLADGTTEDFAWTGGTIKPLAPVDAHRHDDAAGNSLLEFVNRFGVGQGLTRGVAGYNVIPGQYEMDIFSDSSRATVLRTMPVVTGMSLPALLKATSGLKSNGIAELSGDGDTARSFQTIRAAGNFIEGTLKLEASNALMEATLGVVNPSADWLDPSAVEYVIKLTYLSGYRLTVFRNGVAVGTPLACTSTERVRILFSGSEVRFIRSYVNPATEPFYVSPVAASFPYKAWAYAEGSGSDFARVSDVRITEGPTLATVYSIAQKTEDGFASSDPLYVNIYRVDPRVGRGYPAILTLTDEG